MFHHSSNNLEMKLIEQRLKITQGHIIQHQAIVIVMSSVEEASRTVEYVTE